VHSPVGQAKATFDFSSAFKILFIYVSKKQKSCPLDQRFLKDARAAPERAKLKATFEIKEI
jgi:hypothetical protein